MKTVVLTWTCIVLVILAVFISLWVLFGFWWGLSAAAFLYLILVLPYLKAVPTGEKWNTEMFGKYFRTIDQGLRQLTPFYEKIGSKVSDKEEGVLIFRNQTGLVGVEFDDTSAGIDAEVYYRYVDPYKVAYKVENALGKAQAIVEDQLSSIFISMKVDEARRQKATIIRKVLASRTIKRIAEDWGVEITKVVIRDFIRTNKDLEIRAKLAEKEVELDLAKQDVKIAEQKKMAKKEDAVGDAYKIVEDGKALAGQVDEVSKKGRLKPETAAAFLASLRKSEAIQKNGGTTIIETVSGSNPINQGIGFGVGFRGSKSKKGGKP